MCVSYYHYCQLVHNMRGSFEEFCELFLKDKAPVGPIWNHIMGFWRRRNDPNVLFLKYEDMKRVNFIFKSANYLMIFIRIKRVLSGRLRNSWARF